MGEAILRGVLTLCFAALLLVACSKGAEEPDRRGAGEAGEVRTMPQEGTLAPGRYSTGEGFKPSFSFKVGKGWRVLAASGPHALKLGYIIPGRRVAEGKALRFLNVQEVFEPRQEEGKVLFETKPAPEDLVGWFQRHPYLSTDEPETVDIGGATGKQIGVEVNVPEGYRDDHGGGCALPCVPLFRLSSDSVSHITEKGEDRFAVLEDIKGETVIVIISAPGVKFDEFLPKAQRVLETVEWKGA